MVLAVLRLRRGLWGYVSSNIEWLGREDTDEW